LLQCVVPLVHAQTKDTSVDRQTAPDNTHANTADRNNTQPTAQYQSNAKSDRDLAAVRARRFLEDAENVSSSSQATA
jgi:creatinine amidohydrolase/Fe(II)-dependent formamide hydrolase-like protein